MRIARLVCTLSSGESRSVAKGSQLTVLDVDLTGAAAGMLAVLCCYVWRQDLHHQVFERPAELRREQVIFSALIDDYSCAIAALFLCVAVGVPCRRATACSKRSASSTACTCEPCVGLRVRGTLAIETWGMTSLCECQHPSVPQLPLVILPSFHQS